MGDDMVNLDSKVFLSLFKLPDFMPACDEGMELAKRFLEACGDAVANVETDDEVDLRFRFFSRWNDYVEHRAACDKCNEH